MDLWGLGQRTEYLRKITWCGCYKKNEEYLQKKMAGLCEGLVEALEKEKKKKENTQR
jgi:hypothetical protein